MIKKLLCLLVLLLTATTSAWATTPNSIVINGTPQVGDKSISLTYHFDPANVPGITSFVPTLKVKCAADNKWDEMNLSLHVVSSGTTNISLNTLGEFEAGKTYEVCFAYNNGNWVDEVFQSFVPAGPATYTVTLAEGTEDYDRWTISPAEGLEGGEKITVTYGGERKVKSVKAVKKAAKSAEGHALSASAVGEIVGSDGKAYAVADKDNLPSGVTAVAMVAYKSGSNGLAIQLNDISVKMKWADAKTYVEELDAVSGGTWRLPSKADWQNMFVGCAVSGDATVPDANEEMNPIAGFKAKIAATGITWQSSTYWSSTESGSGAWLVGVNLDGSNARATFIGGLATLQLYVRACLAF